MRTIGRTLACLLLGAASTVAACGDEGSRPSIRATLAHAVTAFDARDAPALCELLSKRARLVVGTAQHGKPPLECAKDVRPFFGWLKPSKGASQARIAAIARRGEERATATVRLADGTAVAMPFVVEDGRWRLDGLFDATLSRIQARGSPREDRLMVPAAMAPVTPAWGESGAARIAVRDAARRGRPPCAPVDTADFPLVGGGCAIEVEQAPVDISLRGPFGTMRFARCPIAYRLTIGANGRGWLTNLAIVGGSPCYDVLPCWNIERDMVPWPARIRRLGDGGLAIQVDDVCLDTCLGRFEGDWTLGLSEARRGLRVRSSSQIGTTGWRFAGAWQAKGDRIEIEGGRG